MEKWKNIKNFEGIYKVSNKGNVKSLKRKVKNKGSYSGYALVKEKILKQSTNRLGYKVVTLQKEGKRYHATVHRLVAKAFLEEPKNKNEVNHKDLNKANNNVLNLEWCNRSENINHYYKSIKTTSKYKGVSYQKDRDKWVSYINLNKKRIFIGRFNTEIEAKKERELFLLNIKQKNEEFS